MRRFFLIFFGLILCVVAAVAGCVSYRLYLILPDNSAPSQAKYPQVALDLLKLDLIRDEGSAAKIRRENHIPENFILAGRAARMLFQRLTAERYKYVEGPGWHVNASLAALWVYFRWNEVEMLTIVLHEQFYGPRAVWKGLEQASQGFYGVSVGELSISEVAVLIVNSRAFNKYDPWCDHQAVEVKVLELLDRYRQAFPDTQFDAGQMFARLQSRECERNKD